MVHQPKLVIGEGVPRVVGRHRTRGLAAIGIALVHRDAAEVVLEFFHRVDYRGRPIADARIEAAARSDQQREAGAGLLVANTNVTLLIKRHRTPPVLPPSRWQRALADILSQSDKLSETFRCEPLQWRS